MRYAVCGVATRLTILQTEVANPGILDLLTSEKTIGWICFQRRYHVGSFRKV